MAPAGGRSALRQPQLLPPIDKARSSTCGASSSCQGAGGLSSLPGPLAAHGRDQASSPALCAGSWAFLHLAPPGGTRVPHEPQEPVEMREGSSCTRVFPFPVHVQLRVLELRRGACKSKQGPGPRPVLASSGVFLAPRPRAPVRHGPEQTRSCFPSCVPALGPAWTRGAGVVGAEDVPLDKPAVRCSFSQAGLQLGCS